MSNISQKQVTYLFVDGSNFRQYFNESTQKWFGQEVEFDFNKIKEFFKAEKAFYYDCIDDIKNDHETDDNFHVRVNAQEEKLNKIREVEGCHVFLGSLRKAKKQKNRGQKEVDVMLAVQMMEHAFRGNMNKAVLLSGDLDFRPLVESSIRLGLFVEVVGDRSHISQDLIHSADSHKKLTFQNYHAWSNREFQTFKPIDIKLLSFFDVTAKEDGFTMIKTGIFQDNLINIYLRNSDSSFWLSSPLYSLFSNIALVSNSQDDLELYFELMSGQVVWK